MIKKLSKVGICHINTNGENQDSICHGQNENFYVISLADGVSTCMEAKSGAKIASESLTNLLLKKGEYFLKFNNNQIAKFALEHILFRLKQTAKDNSKAIEEYSSTIASVLVDRKEKKMLCFSLGDSLILAVGYGKCHILAMPSESSDECCVTTTKRAEVMTLVKKLDASSIESVIICSDGAWREMVIKNKLKPEVYSMLINKEYNRLKEFFLEQNCWDDYSFISLDIS